MSRWPYVVAAIVIIIAALEYAPTVGGVLLLLVVLATLYHATSGQLSAVGSGATDALSTGI